MHCIGKDKLLTAASWTQPGKLGETGGRGRGLKSGICFKRGWDVVQLLIVALSGMLNELKETRDESSQSDWLECGTAEVMSGVERCRTEGTKGGEGWRWGVHCETQGATGGKDAWRQGVYGWGGEIGIKRKMVSRFSYWAGALSPSPHPRISTTTPLLLHSGKENKTHSEIIQFSSAAVQCTEGGGYKQRETYFFKAHGTEFVYFACVLRTGDGSACIDMRPEPRRLFEHLWVLLVLCDEQIWKDNSEIVWKGFRIPLSTTETLWFST